MKKLVSLLTAVLCAATMFAEDGTCGENATWNLTDGVLTISGTGAIDDYIYPSRAPWYGQKYDINSIVINAGITSIGEGAFDNCSKAISVTIPNSVTEIKNNAFFSCEGLTSATIPSSVTSIGIYAFSYCNGLTYITVDSENPNYSDIDGVVFNKDKTILVIYPRGKQGKYAIPNSVITIGEAAFESCEDLTSVTIPNSVTTIESFAFSMCDGLTSVTIPNSVTTIGDAAFDLCSGLTTVTIPNSVTIIDSYTFSRCTALTSVTIPNSVTSIGIGTFESCTALTSITIPSSVTSIGVGAFKSCSGLQSVTCEAVTPPALGEDAFDGVETASIPLYVPDGKEDDYNNNAQWMVFSNIKPISAIPTGIESVRNNKLHSTKLLRNGQVLIIRDGKTYNVVGAEVK